MKKLRKPPAKPFNRQLPNDCRLIYRRGTSPQDGREYVQVCSRQRGHRVVWWNFLIYKDRYSDLLTLEIDQNSGWLAFIEVPDVFMSLSSKILAMQKIGDELYTLDSVVAMLEEHGAVEDTQP